MGPAGVGLLVGSFGPRSLLMYFAAILALLALFVASRRRRVAPVVVGEQAPFAAMLRTSPEALAMLGDTRDEPENAGSDR